MATRIKNKLVFLRHPKTGSVATEQLLLRLGGEHVGPGDHNYVHPKGSEITFSTIRNPYDVLASWYVSYGHGMAMEKFLMSYQNPLFTKKGRLFYHAPYSDMLLRYDFLQDELNRLLEGVGLKPLQLARMNETRGKRPFMEYYDTKTIKLVAELFAKDLEVYEER